MNQCVGNCESNYYTRFFLKLTNLNHNVSQFAHPSVLLPWQRITKQTTSLTETLHVMKLERVMSPLGDRCY